MKNKIIEDQLNKVECADLSHFNEETNTYYIPKRVDIKIEVDKCYLVKLKPSFFNNETLRINWNAGSLPKYDILTIDVSKITGKMIRVVAVQPESNYFWNGWLQSDQLEVIKRI